MSVSICIYVVFFFNFFNFLFLFFYITLNRNRLKYIPAGIILKKNPKQNQNNIHHLWPQTKVTIEPLSFLSSINKICFLRNIVFCGFWQSPTLFNSSAINIDEGQEEFCLHILKNQTKSKQYFRPYELDYGGGYKGKCMYHGPSQLLNNTQLAMERSQNNFLFLFIVFFFFFKACLIPPKPKQKNIFIYIYIYLYIIYTC